MTTPALQYCIGSSSLGGLQWVDCGDRADEFIAKAMAVHGATREGVMALIAKGPKSARYHTDWYAYLRDKARGEAADAIARDRAASARRQQQTTLCRKCGQHLPTSRFTTLPASAQTCDDCV